MTLAAIGSLRTGLIFLGIGLASVALFAVCRRGQPPRKREWPKTYPEYMDWKWRMLLPSGIAITATGVVLVIAGLIAG